jgi:heme-degrading monooxygenase HmoA
MIVEYIRYTIPPEQAAAFEAAYAEARTALDSSDHCLGYEIARGVEDPEHYVVRIEWDSLDGHERGFRNGPGFAGFFAAVKPFFEQIDEMRHYEATPIVAAKRSV